MDKRKFIGRKAAFVASAVVALGVGGVLGAIPAGANTTVTASTTYSATTQLTNRPDSGNNTLGSGTWATDTLTRTMTLVDTGADPNRPGYDTFTASLTDTGTFVTNSDVGNPNGLNATTPITGTVTGTVKGTGTYTAFDAPTGTVDSGLVPTTVDGATPSSSDWPSLFFPTGTDFECPGVALTSWTSVASPNPFGTGGCGAENTFSYTYTSCSETWVDANTDNEGDAVGETSAEQAIIGGISGKACPAPTPTPSKSTPVVPLGGVQTGGGKPVSSPWLPFGLGLGVFGLLALGGGVVALRRQRG